MLRLKVEYFILFFFTILFFIPYSTGVNLMNFNPVVNLLFLLLLVFLNEKRFISLQHIKIVILVFFIFIIASFYGFSFNFLIQDIVKFLIPFLLLTLFLRNTNWEKIYVFHLFSICFIFFHVFIAFSEFNLWSNSDYRFSGIIRNTNLTSNVIMFLVVFEVEYYREKKKLNFFQFSTLFLIFSFIVFLTGTRTVLLGYFYFLYIILYDLRIKKVLIVLGIGLFLYFLYLIKDLLWTQLRFDAEASNLTRFSIYTAIFQEIKASYFFFPQGVGAHKLFMKSFNDYPVHNDVLQYWYDLGFLFFLFIAVLIKRCINIIKSDFFRVSIILMLFLTTALHNEMFSIYIWVPIVMIVTLFSLSKQGDVLNF